jgi:hypothetical protein
VRCEVRSNFLDQIEDIHAVGHLFIQFFVLVSTTR